MHAGADADLLSRCLARVCVTAPPYYRKAVILAYREKKDSVLRPQVFLSDFESEFNRISAPIHAPLKFC